MATLEVSSLLSLSSLESVDALVDAVLDAERSEPIVCLTSRRHQTQPALDATEIERIVAGRATIYVVPTGDLTQRLVGALPEGFGAYNGAARIWWPGLRRDDDRADHPFIFDTYGAYDRYAIDRFQTAFENGPRARSPEGSSDESRGTSALTSSSRTLQSEIADLERRLAKAKTEAADTKRTASALRKKLRSATSTHEASAAAGLQFDGLIAAAWARDLRSSGRALGPFRLHPEFLASLQALELVKISEVARVCAEVACGLARELDARDLHRLRAGFGGNDPTKLRQRDGATAWRCAIKRNRPGAPRLHYWKLPDHSVEFACVVKHDDMRIPE